MDHERLHCNDSLPLLHVSYWSKMTKKLSSYRCEIRVMWRAKGSMLEKKKKFTSYNIPTRKEKSVSVVLFFFSCYEWRNTEKLTLSGLRTMEQFQTNREHTLSSCQKIFMWRVGQEKKHLIKALHHWNHDNSHCYTQYIITIPLIQVLIVF